MGRAFKRILALDGGGVRGMFSLQVLAQIERIFRAERQRPDLVLRDEFDFFAGTSTGAITATCLAWGMSVHAIEDLYLTRGKEMFSRAPWYARWRGKYTAMSAARLFQSLFHEDDEAKTPALLGSRRLWADRELKYLLVVMRNASTGSPWPVTNNPLAMYNDPALPDCNLRIPLWKLLRASTAAPTYFPPEPIEIGARRDLFVDGAVTPFNNPALLAALTATLPRYRINWPTGTERLLLVSVGTGSVRARLPRVDVRRIHWIEQASDVAPALIGSVALEQDLICRVLGECRYGAPLDSEMGDLAGASLLEPREKKFSYVRYSRSFTPEETAELRRSTRQRFLLDNFGLIPFLRETGQRYAAEAVRGEHLNPSTAGPGRQAPS